MASGARIIEPRPAGLGQQGREVWRARGLLPYFARRLLQKRYARTWLGRSWLVLRPVMTVAAQVFVFGAILRIHTGVPYLIFFLVNVSAWYLFAEYAYWATRALEINRRSLRVMYVPRLTLLLSAISIALVDYLVYTGILALALLYYVLADGQFYLDLGLHSFATLGGLGLLVAFGLGIGLWLSVPAMQARDVRFGLRFALGFLYFMTPVIYPLSQVPDKYRTVIEVNPLTYPILLVKRGLLGATELPETAAIATGVGLVVLIASGLLFFIRAETVALDHV